MSALPFIYAAGSMTGVGAAATLPWRQHLANEMAGIAAVLTPTRGEQLGAGGVYSATATDTSVFNRASGILARDRNDIRASASLVFMNLLKAPRVSIGSTVELAWCDAYRRPLILVMEESGNIHDTTPHFRNLASYHVTTIDEGIEVAKVFFQTMPVVMPVPIVFDGFDDDGNGKFIPLVPRSF